MPPQIRWLGPVAAAKAGAALGIPSIAGKKGGAATAALEGHLAAISPSGGRAVAAMRRRCAECGLVTNPGNIGRHQIRTGHTGIEHIKENNT